MKRMKRLTCIMMVLVFGMFFGSAFAADYTAEFIELYEETAEQTGALLHGLGHGLAHGELATDKLAKIIDKLAANSNKLAQSARKLKKYDSAGEAEQMAAYMKRIKKALLTKDEELPHLLAYYYLHLNNCLMMNPLGLKELQKEHVEELKEAVDKGDREGIMHLSEHLLIHSDQMHYAALVFGRKIWQKFSTQAKAAAEEIFAAAERNDMAGVKVGIKKIEKPVSMLDRLVKE